MVFILYLKTKQLWIHNIKVLVLHHVLFAALIVVWLAGFFNSFYSVCVTGSQYLWSPARLWRLSDVTLFCCCGGNKIPDKRKHLLPGNGSRTTISAKQPSMTGDECHDEEPIKSKSFSPLQKAWQESLSASLTDELQICNFKLCFNGCMSRSLFQKFAGSVSDTGGKGREFIAMRVMFV